MQSLLKFVEHSKNSDAWKSVETGFEAGVVSFIGTAVGLGVIVFMVMMYIVLLTWGAE